MEESQLYSILVTDASKDGEVIKFTVQTKISENDDSESGKIVLRQFEDFEYLVHCLSTKNESSAIIVPALPPRPIISPAQTDSKMKLSNSVSASVQGDEYSQDCKRFQKLLQDLANHPIYGKDETLKSFLTEEQPPVRAAVKRGLIDSFSNVVANARFQQHPDSDSDFQSRRDGTNLNLLYMKQCHATKERMLNAENGHASQYGNLARTFRNSASMDIQQSKTLMRFIGQFSDVLDDVQAKTKKSAFITEDSLGFSLELYQRYLASCQEMLFRRTCKMVDSENANKALEKAKPKNKEQLENAKEEADKAFKEISEKALIEYNNFTEARIQHFKESLVGLAERKIENHQATCDLLSKAIVELKAID